MCRLCSPLRLIGRRTHPGKIHFDVEYFITNRIANMRFLSVTTRQFYLAFRLTHLLQIIYPVGSIFKVILRYDL